MLEMLSRLNLDAEVDYMLQNNIAVPSASSWASPCILVPKHDGTPRFCSDFRKLNAVTKSDSFPIPHMDDCIDQVGSAKFVSKFDLLKGYWQVPLSKRAQEVSAFTTPSGLYSYNVMPFGLKNAPATFQRLMNHVVSGLIGCSVYLDDVVIYSDTWYSHLRCIRSLFERLMEAHLTINLAKCSFAMATVTYLGHVVGQGRLLQGDDQGLVRPVSFFSRKFNSYQSNYSVIEKEALSLIWALQHFDVYVAAGGPIVVYTDHNALTFLRSLRCPNQRLTRWSLFLQAYNLDFRYTKGSENIIADALSRAPLH